MEKASTSLAKIMNQIHVMQQIINEKLYITRSTPTWYHFMYCDNYCLFSVEANFPSPKILSISVINNAFASIKCLMMYHHAIFEYIELQWHVIGHAASWRNLDASDICGHYWPNHVSSTTSEWDNQDIKEGNTDIIMVSIAVAMTSSSMIRHKN